MSRFHVPMRAAALAVALAAAGAAAAESLYREDTFRALVADNKARRVGDALTVLIVESATAASSADTAGGRRHGLGLEYHDASRRDRNVRLQTRNDFDGRGTTQRAGRLLAQISVTVQEIEPNGDLRIAGEQLLEINRESQRIRLEGRVRPQDVSEANTIQSTRVADARISYVGDGDVSLRARPSWWNTLLAWLGL